MYTVAGISTIDFDNRLVDTEKIISLMKNSSTTGELFFKDW